MSDRQECHNRPSKMSEVDKVIDYYGSETLSYDRILVFLNLYIYIYTER